MRVWPLMSVCRVHRPKSRTERPRKTKIGTEVAHVTCDSDTTFKVKRSKVNVTGCGAYCRICLLNNSSKQAAVAQLSHSNFAMLQMVMRVGALSLGIQVAADISIFWMNCTKGGFSGRAGGLRCPGALVWTCRNCGIQRIGYSLPVTSSKW